METKRILVVNDAAGLAEALAKVIHERLSYECETAESADEAMNRIPLFKPDLVLLDARLKQSASDRSSSTRVGLRALQDIVTDDPAIHVLMITQHKRPFLLWQAVHCGAAGLLDGDEPLNVICDAVAHATNYGDFLTTEDKRQIERIDQLRMTPVRLEVLYLIDRGLTNKKIALELSKSEGRCEDITKELFRLFDVGGRAELLHEARELGFFLQ